MSATHQRLCAGCGIAFAVLFVAGWWLIAGFVPPQSPSLDAETIADLYRTHTGAIRAGISLALFSSAFLVPLAAVIGTQMKRMEGVSPAMADAQLACWAVATVQIALALLAWTVAAFRPERDVHLTQLLNDLGWVSLIMPATPLALAVGLLGVATLSDRRDPPVFPRWSGYFGLWVAFLALPAFLLTFFKTGPFAWSGLLAFWIPLGTFLAWVLLMAFLVLEAVGREERAAPR